MGQAKKNKNSEWYLKRHPEEKREEKIEEPQTGPIIPEPVIIDVTPRNVFISMRDAICRLFKWKTKGRSLLPPEPMN